MVGINRTLVNASFAKSLDNNNTKCVFISYQRNDQVSAKAVADYIIGADIDVYFEEYNKNLKFQMQCKNPAEVTNCIVKGIKASSHMLCIVSSSTLNSNWVPFEIGFGYHKIDLDLLTLKDTPPKGLPAYLRTIKIIRE